jgi:hypothetical protein
MCANVSTHVKVVVGIYRAYDLLAEWHHDQLTRPRDHITEIFLGKSPMESKQLFYEASPLTYPTMDKNHTAFLWCGAQTMILWSRVPSRRGLSRRSSRRGFSCGPSLSPARRISGYESRSTSRPAIRVL